MPPGSNIMQGFITFFLIISIQWSGCFSQEYLSRQENCSYRMCSHTGPVIKFPFRLSSQPEYCGYPGFELFCQGNETVLKLPYSQDLYVISVHYEAQKLFVSDPHGCLPRALLNLNLTSSPFDFGNESIYFYLDDDYPQYHYYKIVNCSSNISGVDSSDFHVVSCLNDLPGHLYLLYSGNDLDILSSHKCSPVTVDLTLSYDYEELYLQWSEPDCRGCFGCGFNSTSNTTQCLASPPDFASTDPYPPKGSNANKVIIGLLSVLAVVVVAVVILLIIRRDQMKKKKEQDIKIEKFLKEYKSLKPTRYSYAEVKRMADGFKNKLGQGGYGNVFKGKLPNGIPVAVKVLENPTVGGEEFINEIGTIGRIHHINVVRLLGFCAEESKRALIYEFMPNESLEKYIYQHDAGTMVISWAKLHEIALGIARGIKYLHQGCDQRIVHFDIKPHNILLDNKFIPKVSDFGLAKLCSKDKSAVTMTAARGTMGYIAPEVFLRSSHMVSHKSDVYSFGMLLLEMVGGRRKNTDDGEGDTSQVYVPEWMYERLARAEELGLRTLEAEDVEIAKRLATIALWCIQWNPGDRPSMKVAVQMLEGSSGSLSIPPNPFTSYSDKDESGASADISEDDAQMNPRTDSLERS